VQLPDASQPVRLTSVWRREPLSALKACAAVKDGMVTLAFKGGLAGVEPSAGAAAPAPAPAPGRAPLNATSAFVNEAALPALTQKKTGCFAFLDFLRAPASRLRIQVRLLSLESDSWAQPPRHVIGEMKWGPPPHIIAAAEAREMLSEYWRAQCEREHAQKLQEFDVVSGTVPRLLSEPDVCAAVLEMWHTLAAEPAPRAAPAASKARPYVAIGVAGQPGAPAAVGGLFGGSAAPTGAPQPRSVIYVSTTAVVETVARADLDAAHAAIAAHVGAARDGSAAVTVGVFSGRRAHLLRSLILEVGLANLNGAEKLVADVYGRQLVKLGRFSVTGASPSEPTPTLLHELTKRWWVLLNSSPLPPFAPQAMDERARRLKLMLGNPQSLLSASSAVLAPVPFQTREVIAPEAGGKPGFAAHGGPNGLDHSVYSPCTR